MKVHILTKSAYYVRIAKVKNRVISASPKIQFNNKNLKGIKLVKTIVECAGGV
ncbi:MAG TPA: hypothetical protein VFK40_05955 [Nitrososphaeraceae archaeon]|nr:hypothetical protein [Nitrososphaeraceae archaeon]